LTIIRTHARLWKNYWFVAGTLWAVAHNVRAAMEAAVRKKFDLLISDIALADGSGMDLMLQLHAISDIPGIAISGFGNTGDIQKSLRAGFSEHLIKPVKLHDLEAAIERAIAGAPVAHGSGSRDLLPCRCPRRVGIK
jgi:DNA-binding NtrC family response regulator